MTKGVDDPSWPLTSTEMGVMVMIPFDGASAGSLTVACMVAVFGAGE